MTTFVEIKKGSIYLSAEVADTYFKGIEAVIILIRDNAIQVLPVSQMAAGGCFLKRRNAAGDRVASAPDVFHANDLGEYCNQAMEAYWSSRDGALLIELENPIM